MAGKALAQTAVSMVVVSHGKVDTLIVRIVSQPVALLTVSVICPTPLKRCPKIVTGKALAHTAVSMVAVSNGRVPTLIVRIVSQPVALLTVSITVAGALNTWPRIVAGKALAQTVVSMVAVSNGSVPTLIVLIVSQPVALLTVSI